MHKRWLEQREQRKKLLMQERLAKNGAVDDFWSSYYRYYKHDLNTTSQNDKKSRKKSPPIGIHLKSQRKKPQQNLKNPILSNESLYISTSTTTTTAPLIPFVTETTTAGIIKTKNELQFSGRAENTTSEITSRARINDRITLNQTTTSEINEITSTPTEHSITYNVTVNNPKGGQTHRPKGKKLSNAIWGRWQKWTKCSRNCGGGVMSQSRQCLSR